MRRLGIVGVGTSHSTDFVSIVNGMGCEPIGNARVVTVFDDDKKKAADFARRYSVENVAEDPSDLIGNIDGALVLYPYFRAADNHVKYGRPLLEAGIPTFLDKPLAASFEAASGIIDLARKGGGPLMSCSALRYAIELEKLLSKLPELGELRVGFFSGPNNLLDYGVHLIETMHTIMGSGVDHVYCESGRLTDAGTVLYSDGKSASLQLIRDSHDPFHVVIHGEKGRAETNISDPVFYRRMLGKFLTMIGTRRPPIPYDHTLEIMATLFSLKRSADSGRKVQLSELRSTC
jgi:predicted dehydrogenase